MLSDKVYRINIPNTLTYLRFMLIPVLWVIYFNGTIRLLTAGLVLAGVTDVIDGPIARRLRIVSKYGSKLDSLADNILILSIVYWTVHICPDILTNHSKAVFIWLFLLIISGITGYIKFRRIGNLHLYSSKIAGVISYTFVVHAYLFSYSTILFYLTLAALIIAASENILIQLLNNEVDEHMGSVLLRK